MKLLEKTKKEVLEGFQTLAKGKCSVLGLVQGLCIYRGSALHDLKIGAVHPSDNVNLEYRQAISSIIDSDSFYKLCLKVQEKEITPEQAIELFGDLGTGKDLLPKEKGTIRFFIGVYDAGTRNIFFYGRTKNNVDSVFTKEGTLDLTEMEDFDMFFPDIRFCIDKYANISILNFKFEIYKTLNKNDAEYYKSLYCKEGEYGLTSGSLIDSGNTISFPIRAYLEKPQKFKIGGGCVYNYYAFPGAGLEKNIHENMRSGNDLTDPKMFHIFEIQYDYELTYL